MNSSFSNKRASNLRCDNDKLASAVFFPNQNQFNETCFPQKFSLSMPFMQYIWKNPSSPEVYQKLIKSCKLFFIKNPLLVIENLSYFVESGWTYCLKSECKLRHCLKNHKKIDMASIKGKIWMTKIFSMSSFHSDLLASALFSKIYRYDVKNLRLYNSRLSYNNLKLLSTGVTQCSLNSVVVTYDNAEKVPMEDIIQLFSCDTIASMFFANSSSNAFCKSYDDFIDACNTVQKVKLNFLPVDFNVHRFYQCLKKTKSRALIAIHSFYISLDVNETVEEILQTDSFDFVPPVIDYFLADKEKLQRMRQIQAKEASKYC